MQAAIYSSLFALIFVVSSPAMAQMDHSMHGSPVAKPASATADAAMGDGLVKKVDKSKGTVTLAHGALPNGMPPMTMAYKVKDAAWLDKLQAGQKVRFATDPADGGMTVTRFELVK
jgi:Cu/Ag efflux protein CusF